MEPIETLIAAHLDAWNAPPGSERDQLVAAAYSPDVLVGEPHAALHGHTGVDEAITSLQAQAPGAVITRSGPIQVAQDLATYAWALGAPGGPTLATGRDVLLVRDGAVASLYVVIDAA